MWSFLMLWLAPLDVSRISDTSCSRKICMWLTPRRRW